MILLSSFSDYLFFDMLARLFHTSIEQVYTTMSLGMLIMGIAIGIVWCVIVKRNIR